jgi:hypothetical protein
LHVVSPIPDVGGLLFGYDVVGNLRQKVGLRKGSERHRVNVHNGKRAARVDFHMARLVETLTNEEFSYAN